MHKTRKRKTIIPDNIVESIIDPLYYPDPKGLDPLIIIKRYAWCLVNIFDLFKYALDDVKKYKSFYEKHFLSIWSNHPLNDKLSLSFLRYDALIESIKNVNVVQTFITEIPTDLYLELCEQTRRRRKK